MSRRTLPLVFAIGSMLSLGARGAGPLPPARSAFRSFGVQDGLTSLSPLCMAQDHRGLLWVGTEDGLFSYDGQRFTRSGTEEGLPSNSIMELAIAPGGEVLAGTEHGLARIAEDGRITTDRSVPASLVTSISVASDGCAWVCVDQPSGGLLRSCAGKPFEPADGWPGGDCTTSLAVPSGELLVATHTGLAVRAPGGAWRVSEEPELQGDRIDSLLLDSRGRLWARSIGRLLMRPAGATRFERVDVGLGRAYHTGRLLEGPDGDPWVPSVSGLAMWREGSWKLFGVGAGLPESSVNLVFRDAEGSAWIGGFGLQRWLGGERFESYSTGTGLPSDVVWSIVRDRVGTVWVGTDLGLASATPAGWKTEPFTRGVGIKSVAFASDGSLWLGASPLEVLHWTPSTGKVERFGARDGLRGRQVTSILVDPDGLVWVAAEVGGLSVAQPSAGRPLIFHPAEVPGTNASETFRSLVLDAHQRLWAGGSGGLLIREGGAWRRFTTRDGLLDDFAAYLFARPDGSVRLSSWESRGLSLATYEHGQLTLTHDRSLAGRKVFLLGEDAVHHWQFVGTGAGLAILDGQRVRTLSQTDGLPGDDYDANAFMADPNGDVWLGTSTGLLVYHAALDQGAPAPPPRVLLEGILLGTRTLREGRNPAPVDHEERTLDVRFAGLSFANERKVHYGTRLVGLSQDWRESPIPEARYTNLSPGAYTFEVRARVGDGPWGEPAQASFLIRPAFWQTRWFQGLGGLLIVAILVSAVIWRRAAFLAARALAESEERLRSVFTVMREGVVLYDAREKPIIWNAAAERILGLTGAQLRREVRPEPTWQVLREDGTPFPRDEWPVAVTCRTGEPQTGVLIAIRRAGGQTAWVSVSTQPLATRSEHGFAVVTTLAEVTELRAATVRANEASQLKSQFLANMSHEIRTPLNAVLGLSRLALEEPSPEKIAEYLGIIQRSGAGLLGLVNDILDFSKIEAGKLTIERIPFLLQTQLQEIGQALEPMADAKGLRFVRHLAPGLPDAVLGDPLRVRQVITNLVTNAIKFTQKGTVELSAAPGDGAEVIFVVRDTGIGMTPAQQERLFEAFTQADSTTTRRFGGTGLGLAISRSLSRAMGGELGVTSVAGEGSTFTFRCPLAPASSEDLHGLTPTARLMPAPQLRGLHALVAEDNKVNQLLLRVLLQKAGLEVTVVEDGRQAVDAILSEGAAFDVVLMDVQMPVMDGYQATIELRERLGSRAPPVIAVSAHAMPAQIEESAQAGMVAHLTKPIDASELYALLARTLHGLPR